MPPSSCWKSSNFSHEKTLPSRDRQTSAAPGQEAFLTPYLTTVRAGTRGNSGFKSVKKYLIPSGKCWKALQITTKNLVQAFGSKMPGVRVSPLGPRRSKLCIACSDFFTKVRAHSFCCSSYPTATRFFASDRNIGFDRPLHKNPEHICVRDFCAAAPNLISSTWMKFPHAFQLPLIGSWNTRGIGAIFLKRVVNFGKTAFHEPAGTAQRYPEPFCAMNSFGGGGLTVEFCFIRFPCNIPPRWPPRRPERK